MSHAHRRREIGGCEDHGCGEGYLGDVARPHGDRDKHEHDHGDAPENCVRLLVLFLEDELAVVVLVVYIQLRGRLRAGERW